MKAVVITIIILVASVFLVFGAKNMTIIVEELTQIGENPGLSLLNPSRTVISDVHLNYYVCDSGCNYTTIQAAVDKAGLFLRHNVHIYVNGSDYTAKENVTITGIFG